LLALVAAASQSNTAAASNRVDLVDEDDARRDALGLVEHLDEFGGGDTEKWHARFASHRARKQRLAGAWWADQQHPVRQISCGFGPPRMTMSTTALRSTTGGSVPNPVARRLNCGTHAEASPPVMAIRPITPVAASTPTTRAIVALNPINASFAPPERGGIGRNWEVEIQPKAVRGGGPGDRAATRLLGATRRGVPSGYAFPVEWVHALSASGGYVASGG
jgi:hypothetical protein